MIRKADVDDYKTNQPLRNTGVKAETEGLMIAAQDQSLPSKSNFARIVKGGTSPLPGYATSTKNIISGSPELAKTDHLKRHNKAAAYIKEGVCQHHSIEVTERWNEEVTILWDMQIHTDRELSANKPDMLIKDHANRCCKLIDASVSSDRNTSTKVIKSF